MRPAAAFALLILLAFGTLLFTNRFYHSNPTPMDNPDPPPNIKAPESSQGATKTFDEVKKDAVQATLEVEGRGTMKLELYPEAAPKTVAHIVSLCKKDFYKGILFHRVMSGFVAQAGDPESKKYQPSDLQGLDEKAIGEKYHLGGGGSGSSVPLEKGLPHSEFSIGLARSNAEDSGDSQFYINLNNNNNLDAAYCVFGRITSGQDVATAIQAGDRITRFSVP